MDYAVQVFVIALRPGQEKLVQKRHALERILVDILILVLVMEHVKMIISAAALMPTKEMIVVKINQTLQQNYLQPLLLPPLQQILQQNLQQNLQKNALPIVSTMDNAIQPKGSVTAIEDTKRMIAQVNLTFLNLRLNSKNRSPSCRDFVSR